MDALDDRRPAPPVPEMLNLAQHVLWANGANDDQIALSVLSLTGAERWSYGRLRQAVLSVAGGLRELGLMPGQRVLLRLGNTPGFPIAYLGAIAAGILPVPTSAALGEEEVTRLAIRADVNAVIGGDDIALPDGDFPVLAIDDLMQAAPLSECVETRANDPAYILFTSGTQGEPLGVVHAHQAIWARRRMIDGWYGLTAEDRMLHAGAFNWSFTLGTGLMDPWSIGGTALVLAEGTDLTALPLLAKRHQATIIAGAPGVFRKLLRAPLPTLPHLRHGLSAGETLPETLRERWRKATGTDIHEAFGQTECSTFISGSPAQPAPKGTIGRGQPGRAIAILGDNGPVARGELGRIAVDRSDPGIATGFIGSAEDRHQGDWFLTGDLGVMRDDGCVEYHGRADDILTAGGYRVSPFEIEAVIERCPGVDEAAAVDLRIDGETVIIGVFYSGEDISETTLSQYASAHLARYKQPRRYVRLDALPRNVNGKLLRKALRAVSVSS